MTIFSDIADAVTPSESAEDRTTARAEARRLARPGDWFSAILDHHVQLEAAFAAVKAAGDAASRRAAQKALGVILTGHAIAEEAVIYPAMAATGEKRHASHGYTEQATVKMEMAELEQLDPMSQDYLDKLEMIREAVAHHMYEEEGTWFPALRQADGADQALLGQRYNEEYDRYVGKGAMSF